MGDSVGSAVGTGVAVASASGASVASGVPVAPASGASVVAGASVGSVSGADVGNAVGSAVGTGGDSAVGMGDTSGSTVDLGIAVAVGAGVASGDVAVDADGSSAAQTFHAAAAIRLTDNIKLNNFFITLPSSVYSFAPGILFTSIISNRPRFSNHTLRFPSEFLRSPQFSSIRH